ncbi:MAG: hypothetical protein IJ558_04835 [Treponema sp.]|nr:hypothetical protein [Treponema sp.]
MKPGGKDGRLYKIKELAAIQGGSGVTLPEGHKFGFYRIKSVGTNSALPQPDLTKEGARAVRAGDVVHLWPGQSLASGDSVIPLELTLIGFVSDVSNSRNGNKTDITTQENLESGVREYTVSPFTEGSGTINGMVDVDSEAQKELLNQFTLIADDDGEHITIYPAKQKKQDYMMSRRETEITGEVAMWEHFPVTVDSIAMDKPLDGAQNFNFNYSLDGGNNPGVIYYKVKDTQASSGSNGGD